MYKSKLNKIVRQMEKAAVVGIDAAANHYANAIKASISGPSPSPIGQPPGMSSGRLREAITALSGPSGGGEAAALIGISTAVGGIKKTPPWLYGLFLEKYMHNGKNRPFMGPMARNSQVASSALQKFTAAFQKVFK